MTLIHQNKVVETIEIEVKQLRNKFPSIICPYRASTLYQKRRCGRSSNDNRSSKKLLVQ